MYIERKPINNDLVIKNQGKSVSDSRIYFTKGRDALYAGLRDANIQCMLVPEFICEIVTNVLKSLDITIIYYPVDDLLKPQWSFLENINTKDIDSIMMVHYFGFPQEIKKFLSFASERELFLVDNNSHGFGSHYKGKMLGTFGAMGICSPNKTLPTSKGGILYTQSLSTESFPMCSEESPYSFENASRKFKHKLKSSCFFRKYLRKRPPFEIADHFSEEFFGFNNYVLDEQTVSKIESYNITELIAFRQKWYRAWLTWSDQHKDLQPIYRELDQFVGPWLFPVYVTEQSKRAKWFDWGWENGIEVFSWPTLPREVMDKNSRAVDIWNRLICFPINPFYDFQKFQKALVQ